MTPRLSLAVALVLVASPVLAQRALGVAPSSSMLMVGQSVQLVLTGQTGTPRWTSSSTAVATVSASGLVTARGAGSATISVRSGGRTATAIVTVMASPPGPVDCVLSAWVMSTATAWSVCSNATQSRTETWTRTILTPPTNGGAACGLLVEQRTVTQACVAVPPHPCDVAEMAGATLTAGALTVQWCHPLDAGIDAAWIYKSGVATPLAAFTVVTPVPNSVGLAQYESSAGSFVVGSYAIQLTLWNDGVESARSAPFALTVK